MSRSRKFTLMPAIAVTALALVVALPTLSSVRLYAATAPRFATVTVQPGDTLWGLAAAHSAPTADVQEVVDQIAADNHLRGSIQPGQRLRIPE